MIFVHATMSWFPRFELYLEYFSGVCSKKKKKKFGFSL